MTKTKLVPKLLQLIKLHARTQGSLATTVTSSQKTGKAPVNDLGNTKARGTGTTKPLAQASRALAARYLYGEFMLTVTYRGV